MTEYRLDELGWFQFERLCQSVLKARHGLSLEAWGGSGDLGRDAYAAGPLRHPGEDKNDGPFVFQAKFVAGANTSGADPMDALLSGVRKELVKIGNRKETGVWETPAFYTLLTNVPLTAERRKKVERLLVRGLPNTELIIQGGRDIDALLDNSPNVRLAFPQILGLRDIFALLEQSVHRDIITRSRGAVKMSEALARTFIPTEAYTKALDVLGAHRFVVLTGPPEMGKTTIARMIALAQLSDGREAYECRGPGDLLKVHDPDKAQVFVADDAFGSTEYQPAKGNAWADELDGVIHLMNSSHWLLLTSRPAPLRTALEQLHLQGAAEGFPDPQEVLVDASNLGVEEKAQMLYRHAKSAVESEEGRALIAKNARRIVEHQHFTPLRIHRFVTDQLPKILERPAEDRERLTREAVTVGLETSTNAMKTSFARLPRDCKALMLSMLDSGETVIELDELAPTFERHLGSAPERSVRTTAEIINAHFVRMVDWTAQDNNEPTHVEWVHPSVRDLVIDHLMASADARRAFLRKAGIDGLMLALSSGGGAAGERQFPLLDGEEEWAEVKRRLAELPTAGDRGVNTALLALMSDTARLSTSVDEATGEKLRNLTRVGLEALRDRWSTAKSPISVADLRNFYRAAASLLPSVEGPNVEQTWNELVESVDGGKGDIDDLLATGGEWIDLAELLARHDRGWLARLQFPSEYTARLEGLLERVEEEKELLGYPYVSDEDDPEEYYEDAPGLDWMDGLEDILGAIASHVPGLKERCDAVTSSLFDIQSEWEVYSERQKAFNEPEPDDDRDGRGGHYSGAGEVFSVGDFFSDL